MADQARLLVLYHSSYGHTETLAYAVAHGARAVEGVQLLAEDAKAALPHGAEAADEGEERRLP